MKGISRDVACHKLSPKVRRFLSAVGLPCHNKVYQHMGYILTNYTEEDFAREGICWLYKDYSSKFSGLSSSAVERGIRHGIIETYYILPVAIRKLIFGNSVNERDGEYPDSGHYIANMVVAYENFYEQIVNYNEWTDYDEKIPV